MDSGATVFERGLQAVERPLWLESLVGLDWTMLHLAPVYYGLGAPKGDGSAVIVVPGFMGADFYLVELYLWLRRIGYKPYLSGIGWNADCLNTLTKRLTGTVSQAHADTGHKVHLIGHSLGGILSRSVAFSHADKIASVITLGTPFRGVRSHPWVLRQAEKVRRRIFARANGGERPDECYTGFCDCPAVNALANGLPASINQTAIYTKFDGIVDWKSCLNDDPATDFEVTGTHIGLAFNHQVYSHIAKKLAPAGK
jgi:pimeloyl-ACP methyl ester carboxylesterase